MCFLDLLLYFSVQRLVSVTHTGILSHREAKSIVIDCLKSPLVKKNPLVWLLRGVFKV